MLHLNLQQFLYAFALGALFAYMARITDSIIPSMVAHFTINGSQVLMQRFFIFIAKTLNQDISTMIQEPSFYEKLLSLGAVLIFALFITPIAGVLIYALRSLHSPKNIRQENFVEAEPSNQRVFNLGMGIHRTVYSLHDIYSNFRVSN